MARFHTRPHVLVVGVAVLLGIVTTSCSSHRSAFCRALDRGDAGFDSPRVTDQLRALDRVIEALPARDRGDIVAVRDYIAIAAHRDGATSKQVAATITRYFQAVKSLDPRLRDECHVPVQGRPAPFVPQNVSAP